MSNNVHENPQKVFNDAFKTWLQKGISFNILNEKVSLHCALHLFFITENISKTFSAFDKYYQYKTIVDIATVKYDLYICTATSCKQRFKDYSVCL